MTRLNESKRTQQAQSENCFKIFIPYVKITFGKKSKTSKTTVATPQR